MLRYLFVEEYSITVPSDRKSTCLYMVHVVSQAVIHIT